MKKSIRQAIILAMVMILAVTSTALADTIVSSSFKFNSVMEQPEETPTVEPTEEPAVTSAEEDVEAQQPETEPEPDVKLSVTTNLADGSVVMEGTELVLTLTVEGAEGYVYTIQWQQSSDGGASWTDVAGANAIQYRLKLKPEHTGMYWRATIDLGEPVSEE